MEENNEENSKYEMIEGKDIVRKKSDENVEVETKSPNQTEKCEENEENAEYVLKEIKEIEVKEDLHNASEAYDGHVDYVEKKMEDVLVKDKTNGELIDGLGSERKSMNLTEEFEANEEAAEYVMKEIKEISASGDVKNEINEFEHINKASQNKSENYEPQIEEKNEETRDTSKELMMESSAESNEIVKEIEDINEKLFEEKETIKDEINITDVDGTEKWTEVSLQGVEKAFGDNDMDEIREVKEIIEWKAEDEPTTFGQRIVNGSQSIDVAEPSEYTIQMAAVEAKSTEVENQSGNSIDHMSNDQYENNNKNEETVRGINDTLENEESQIKENKNGSEKVGENGSDILNLPLLEELSGVQEDHTNEMNDKISESNILEEDIEKCDKGDSSSVKILEDMEEQVEYLSAICDNQQMTKEDISEKVQKPEEEIEHRNDTKDNEEVQQNESINVEDNTMESQVIINSEKKENKSLEITTEEGPIGILASSKEEERDVKVIPYDESSNILTEGRLENEKTLVEERNNLPENNESIGYISGNTQEQSIKIDISNDKDHTGVQDSRIESTIEKIECQKLIEENEAEHPKEEKVDDESIVVLEEPKESRASESEKDEENTLQKEVSIFDNLEASENDTFAENTLSGDSEMIVNMLEEEDSTGLKSPENEDDTEQWKKQLNIDAEGYGNTIMSVDVVEKVDAAEKDIQKEKISIKSLKEDGDDGTYVEDRHDVVEFEGSKNHNIEEEITISDKEKHFKDENENHTNKESNENEVKDSDKENIREEGTTNIEEKEENKGAFQDTPNSDNEVKETTDPKNDVKPEAKMIAPNVQNRVVGKEVVLREKPKLKQQHKVTAPSKRMIATSTKPHNSERDSSSEAKFNSKKVRDESKGQPSPSEQKLMKRSSLISFEKPRKVSLLRHNSEKSLAKTIRRLSMDSVKLSSDENKLVEPNLPNIPENNELKELSIEKLEDKKTNEVDDVVECKEPNANTQAEGEVEATNEEPLKELQIISQEAIYSQTELEKEILKPQREDSYSSLNDRHNGSRIITPVLSEKSIEIKSQENSNDSEKIQKEELKEMKKDEKGSEEGEITNDNSIFDSLDSKVEKRNENSSGSANKNISNHQEDVEIKENSEKRKEESESILIKEEIYPTPDQESIAMSNRSSKSLKDNDKEACVDDMEDDEEPKSKKPWVIESWVCDLEMGDEKDPDKVEKHIEIETGDNASFRSIDSPRSEDFKIVLKNKLAATNYKALPVQNYLSTKEPLKVTEERKPLERNKKKNLFVLNPEGKRVNRNEKIENNSMSKQKEIHGERSSEKTSVKNQSNKSSESRAKTAPAESYQPDKTIPSLELEFKKIKSNIEEMKIKIQKNKKQRKEFVPYVFNNLQPYSDTNMYEAVRQQTPRPFPGATSRITATDLCDPWENHKMDKLSLPPIRDSSSFLTTRSQSKYQREEKVLHGSQNSPKTSRTRTRPINSANYSLRSQSHQSQLRTSRKIDDDYQRTRTELYRLSLDKLNKTSTSVGQANIRSALFAYLQNSPGSKKALYEVIRHNDRVKAGAS